MTKIEPPLLFILASEERRENFLVFMASERRQTIGLIPRGKPRVSRSEASS